MLTTSKFLIEYLSDYANQTSFLKPHCIEIEKMEHKVVKIVNRKFLYLKKTRFLKMDENYKNEKTRQIELY